MMDQKNPLLIVLAGPTSSGKSDLAIWLAGQLGGELISCDSLQVYRRLDIGTAKPNAEDRKRVVHHQLDIIDIDEHYSAGRYALETRKIIQDISSRSQIPIVVGGTGFYLRSLLFGLSSFPEIHQDLREKVILWQKEQGTVSCWNRLEEMDPEGAKSLHPNDTTRVMRALELVLSTGIPLQRLRKLGFSGSPSFTVCGIGCDWLREDLYERINHRTEEMMNKGWIEEVQSILVEYPSDLKPLKSIGYREIINYLQGNLDREDLVPVIQQRTRQFAKRQLTWFRSDVFLQWYSPSDKNRILSKIRVCLDKNQCKQT